jgi:hypothetical protein
MERKRNGRILKLCVETNGYVTIELNKNGRSVRKLVHRLVYESFIGSIKSGFSIHHLDKNRKNNRTDNLQQLSCIEHNKLHSHVAWNKGLKGFRAGEKRDYDGYSNLRKKCICIETGNIYQSVSEAIKEYGRGVPRALKYSDKTCRGYHFKYYK